MLNISLTLEAAEEAKLRAKAKSLGLSISTYARQVLRDSLSRDPNASHAEVLRHFHALVPVLAALVGVAKDFTPEQREKFMQSAALRYEQELKKGKAKPPESE